jgi:hypothetical protein
MEYLPEPYLYPGKNQKTYSLNTSRDSEMRPLRDRMALYIRLKSQYSKCRNIYF